MTHLPSTMALRAFEVAARRLNFTHTASELNLTQGAVSHQIRELETRLGVALFERQGRGLELSSAGRQYLPYVQDALDRLRAGGRALHDDGPNNALTVSLSPPFAAKWLVPRLGDFLTAHPDMDLRISASMHHVTFADDGIDMAIRHGNGDWPDLHVTRLWVEEIFPVCSPALLASGPPLREIADLANHVLIHDRSRAGWATWLDNVGADTSAIDLDRGPGFNETSLAIDAAVAAQGVALSRSALAAGDLAAGRLVQPLREAHPAPFAYWIVCPKSSAEQTNIVRFRNWLLEEAATDADNMPAAGSKVA
ncbi:MAG: transcriptional regulator GcvA [Alphaproteobacteria bacterium]|nr:transcriptional regulator GcvA [Alphaproteobacteria bacterium]